MLYFISSTKKKKWNELVKFEQQSHELLDATLNMEEEEVASGIEKIHTQEIFLLSAFATIRKQKHINVPLKNTKNNMIWALQGFVTYRIDTKS